MNSHRSNRGSAVAGGFSLLEVLVAFVILALVVTALFRLFSGALNNASVSDEYSRALLLAQSRLTALGVEQQPLREGAQQGTSEDGRYAWEERIDAFNTITGNPELDRLADLSAVRLWRLAVTVSWPGERGGTRSYSLATVRLAPKENQ